MRDTPCPGCGLVYDLSTYAKGQRCRCRCGQVLIAQGPSPRKIARTIHCSACGGNLEKGRPDCPYCSALVDLTDARMTAYCEVCLSMNKEGALFCSDCGTPIVEREAEAPEATDAECPRCHIRLRRRNIGEHRPLECPMCCGLFVATEELTSLIETQKEKGDVAATSQTQPERASLVVDDVTYLKCPLCGGTMNRVNYGRFSGVIIDTCKAHGHWLDEGELEKIAKWIATGGLAKMRQREIEELRAERERLSSTPRNSGGYSTPVASYGNEDILAEGILWAGWGIVKLLARLFVR